jgi:hypothetical protein
MCLTDLGEKQIYSHPSRRRYISDRLYLPSRASVARNYMDELNVTTLSQLPGQSVLSATIAYQQDA